MKTVINSRNKQDAINSCAQFLRYYPYRYAAVVKMGAYWGWCSGKTKARMNNLAKQGLKVYMVTRD